MVGIAIRGWGGEGGWGGRERRGKGAEMGGGTDRNVASGSSGAGLADPAVRSRRKPAWRRTSLLRIHRRPDTPPPAAPASGAGWRCIGNPRLSACGGYRNSLTCPSTRSSFWTTTPPSSETSAAHSRTCYASASLGDVRRRWSPSCGGTGPWTCGEASAALPRTTCAPRHTARMRSARWRRRRHGTCRSAPFCANCSCASRYGRRWPVARWRGWHS
eukprot:scaffold19029_cov119-Isochrysis_galbana.AAC.11